MDLDVYRDCVNNTAKWGHYCADVQPNGGTSSYPSTKMNHNLHLLGQFWNLDTIHNILQNLDGEWGYVLTMAWDDHPKDIELIPNLKQL